MDREEMIKTLSTKDLTILNKLMNEYCILCDQEIDSLVQETLQELYQISEHLMKPETMHRGFFKLGMQIAKFESLSMEESEQEDDNGHC